MTGLVDPFWSAADQLPTLLHQRGQPDHEHHDDDGDKRQIHERGADRPRHPQTAQGLHQRVQQQRQQSGQREHEQRMADRPRREYGEQNNKWDADRLNPAGYSHLHATPSSPVRPPAAASRRVDRTVTVVYIHSTLGHYLGEAPAVLRWPFPRHGASVRRDASTAASTSGRPPYQAPAGHSASAEGQIRQPIRAVHPCHKCLRGHVPGQQLDGAGHGT